MSAITLISIMCITALACVLSSGLTYAQSAEELRPYRFEQFKGRLKLTEDQITTVEPLFSSYFERRKKLLQQYGLEFGEQGQIRELDRKQKRELRQSINSERSALEKSLSAVLSKEQMQEFKKMQQEMRERFKEKMRESKRY